MYNNSENSWTPFISSSFSRLGNLFWHDGLIPDQEIWIKVGADKGGTPVSTVKFNFQITNVREPNSIDNTVNFACYEGADSITNITMAMDLMEGQLERVKEMTWRYDPINFFFFFFFAP